MNTPLITKIKHADGFVTVQFREKKGMDEKDITFKSHEKPHVDLFDALQACEAGVRQILELPIGWRRGEIKITGVTWSMSETTEVRGACLIAQVSLSTADAPLNIVTPHLPFAQYSEGGNSPLMPDDVQALLDTLEIEVMAYVSGRKRAQLSLELVA